MKKRLFLALCLVLAVMLTAIPAMAAGSVDAWLSAYTTSVTPGSTVNVTVSAEVDNCGSGGISVGFDSAVFELTGGSCTLSGTDLSYFDASTKDGAFAYAGSNAISGEAFRFTLKVKDSAPAGSHTVNVTFLADGSSDSCSVTISLACSHSYDNDCDESCNKCGATREVSHSFDGGKVTTPATCSTEGVTTYTCTSCGKTKTEAIATAAHTWDSGKVTKEATCKNEGEKLFTCTACQTTKTESVDTLAHNYAVTGYVPATCEERGSMDFTCADCGYHYDDYIEAKGHSYDFDCDPECNTCGATRETEHDFGEDWFSDKTTHFRQCNICGYAEDPMPHKPGAEATETEDQVCLDCGFILDPAGKHTHKPVGNFLSSDDKHWYLCACGELMGENAHHWSDKGIEDGQHIYKCAICSRVKTEPVETTAPTTKPTEATTVPATTQAPTTAPAQSIIDKITLSPWMWIIPAAIAGAAILFAGCYIGIGLILGYRKQGKFDAKRKTASAEPVEEEAFEEPEEIPEEIPEETPEAPAETEE